MSISSAIVVAALTAGSVAAAEVHVAPTGDDGQPGTQTKPFKTIQAAANLAQPGDTITVHAGTYRERVNPPRGGTSDQKRITYQAAPGENVVITGSEAVKGWKRVTNDTWKVSVPNRFFGSFNPYSDVIQGSWFGPRGRLHHTGCVYQDGNWLMEAAQLDDVLKPANLTIPGAILLNVAWIRPSNSTTRIAADQFTDRSGTHTWPCAEGGQCVGSIEDGHWVRYERVDFGDRTDSVEIRAASATAGGTIELRDGGPDGPVLGMCVVTGTGGWQTWKSFHAKITPSSGVKTLCLLFNSNQRVPSRWFGRVDEENTILHVQFPGSDPNVAHVEINVRQTVFYPEKPFLNYITVRGFILENAAPNWAPPNAEQKAIIGTHWSKGWIIENNTVRYSRCTGISLGKYGDEWDNKSDTAPGFVETVKRALKNGWNKETVGSHIVRNNHIHHCEQAGIVGSMGGAFSRITGNEIHDIHTHRLFDGAEQAGIKFHGAIDTEITGNHIYRTSCGIWVDWMAQGTRISGNLLHDNDHPWDVFGDLLIEADHGPYLVDNNIMLSPRAVISCESHGGAYVHNYFGGSVNCQQRGARSTPVMKPHDTALIDIKPLTSGDTGFFNNLFAQGGTMGSWDRTALPMTMAGNVYLKGTKPSTNETASLLKPEVDPHVTLLDKPDGWHLNVMLDNAWDSSHRQLMTTERLGKTKLFNLSFENPDSSPLRIDTDYLGKNRNPNNPFPGPFEITTSGRREIQVWPKR